MGATLGPAQPQDHLRNVVATNLRGALHLPSISSFIDLSFPAASKADLWMKSITRELYTKLDMKLLNQVEKFPVVSYEMQGQLGAAPKSAWKPSAAIFKEGIKVSYSTVKGRCLHRLFLCYKGW